MADAVERSRDLGADAIELHTGAYANNPGAASTLPALRDAAALGARLGLAVHAGHGLTVRNVGPVAGIPAIAGGGEAGIGHGTVGRLPV